MSTLKTDAISAATGTNTNLALTGKGTGKVALGDAALLVPDADGAAGQILTTDGSLALTFAATPGTSGNVLTSNGSAWTSAAAGGGFTLGTPVATTSGTSFSFTGVPSGTNVLILMWEQVSVADGTDIYMQLGDAGGIETTGYLGKTSVAGATNIYIDNSAGTSSTITTGFPIGVKDGGGYMNGQVTLRLLNSSTNLWSYTAMIAADGGCVVIAGGSKALSAELTQFTVAGNTFDLGQANIMYS